MRDMVSLDFGELSGQGELFSKLKWKGGRFGESKKTAKKMSKEAICVHILNDLINFMRGMGGGNSLKN